MFIEQQCLRCKLREIRETKKVSYAVVRHFLELRARAVLGKDVRRRVIARVAACEVLSMMRPRATSEATRLEKEFDLR